MSLRSIACAFACVLAVGVALCRADILLRPRSYVAQVFRPEVRALGFEVTAQSAAAPASPARDPASPPDASEVRFAGEVIDGQPFERDIGRDLVFRLIPLNGDAAGGWVIEIVPKAQASDDPAEFSAIATPPYHFYNQRYLGPAYGYSAREAVAISPRTFYFVQTLAAEHIADEVVNAALYPGAVPDQEKDRIAAEAASLHLCRGQLRIVRSRVTTGKLGEPDVIAWLKFEVALSFSPGLTLQQILAPKPPSAH